MTASTVLVIAADADLRRSLVFALEAEGYQVTAQPNIGSARALPARRFDCTVLDHSAASGSPAAEIAAFSAANGPVVLLAEHSLPDSPAWLAGFVEMRALGEALVNIVRTTIGRELHPNST